MSEYSEGKDPLTEDFGSEWSEAYMAVSDYADFLERQRDWLAATLADAGADVLATLAWYYSTADKMAATALAMQVLGREYMALLPTIANGTAPGVTRATDASGWKAVARAAVNAVAQRGPKG